MTTQAKRVAKLEAQVASLRSRLSARTTQLILVLDQVQQMKSAVESAGLEFNFVEQVDLSESGELMQDVLTGVSNPVSKM